MKVCIAGDSGLLGQAFVQVLTEEKDNEVWGVSSSPFGGTPFWRPLRGFCQHKVYHLPEEFPDFSSELKNFAPDILINCTALADIKACEENPAVAEKTNARIPELLARLTREQGIDFIHISTDQVFDGKKTAPYSEEDKPQPIHVYGRTKLEGDRAVLREHPAALVVRTNIVGFRDLAKKSTFAEWLCHSLLEKEKITLCEDFITSPLHVRDLVSLTLAAHGKGLRGILNIAAHDAASKFHFGELLAKNLGLDFSAVKKGTLGKLGLVPPRPPFLALQVGKAEGALGVRFPSVPETIQKIAKDFRLRLKETSHVFYGNSDRALS